MNYIDLRSNKDKGICNQDEALVFQTQKQNYICMFNCRLELKSS